TLAWPAENDPAEIAEPNFGGRPRHRRRFLGFFAPPADHRIDAHVKFGVLGQVAEIAVEHLQALLRDLIGRDIVNADLQIFESGRVELLDPVSGHEITVAYQPGDHPARAYV